MERIRTAVASAFIMIFIAGCGPDYSAQLIGRWRLTGAICNEDGLCNRQINTKEMIEYRDNGTGAVFAEGQDRPTHFMYAVRRNRIEVQLDSGTAFDEILSLKNDIMLIKTTSVDGKVMGTTRWARAK